MSPDELERLRTDPGLQAAREAGQRAAASAVEQGLPATITIRSTAA